MINQLLYRKKKKFLELLYIN